MSDTSVATTEQRKPPARQISRKVATAIEAMVWQGLKRGDAAQAAGLTEHSLYVALRSPHVKQRYLAECEVLRTSGRARRIHRLEAMAEQDENKAAVVNACIALDRDNGESATRSSTSAATPGVTIHIHERDITASHSAPQRVTEAKPLISLERDFLTENVRPSDE